MDPPKEPGKWERHKLGTTKPKDGADIFRSIVCSIVILSIGGVVSYRLATAHVHFVTFDFSQMLSLAMSVFSVGLSAAFYYMATDTSNKFYDNTYGFMKDLFEILGRIEERFGERLEHIRRDTAEIRHEVMQSSGEQPKPVATESIVSPSEEKKSLDE
jgi:hypothetical protein